MNRSTDRSRIESVRTNVVTGFLGAGKTTLVQYLLRHKPEGERWAVLVNEFGEVGIDGALLASQGANQPGVFLREVPGGCMCCTAGVSMQVALNTLLRTSRPDRLLIEPTGLGHPREVLTTLASEHYRDVLDVRATVVVVDARKARDPRYSDHSTFREQLDVADLIVANKAETYGTMDRAALSDLLDELRGDGGRRVVEVTEGAIEPEWLETPAERYQPDSRDAVATEVPEQESARRTAPDGGHLRIDNQGEGFATTGWIFASELRFDLEQLRRVLHTVAAERIKGTVITDAGSFSLNAVEGEFRVSEVDALPDSRIEILRAGGEDPSGLELAILSCLVSPPRT